MWKRVFSRPGKHADNDINAALGWFRSSIFIARCGSDTASYALVFTLSAAFRTLAGRSCDDYYIKSIPMTAKNIFNAFHTAIRFFSTLIQFPTLFHLLLVIGLSATLAQIIWGIRITIYLAYLSYLTYVCLYRSSLTSHALSFAFLTSCIFLSDGIQVCPYKQRRIDPRSQAQQFSRRDAAREEIESKGLLVRKAQDVLISLVRWFRPFDLVILVPLIALEARLFDLTGIFEHFLKILVAVLDDVYSGPSEVQWAHLFTFALVFLLSHVVAFLIQIKIGRAHV